MKLGVILEEVVFGVRTWHEKLGNLCFADVQLLKLELTFNLRWTNLNFDVYFYRKFSTRDAKFLFGSEYVLEKLLTNYRVDVSEKKLHLRVECDYYLLLNNTHYAISCDYRLRSRTYLSQLTIQIILLIMRPINAMYSLIFV